MPTDRDLPDPVPRMSVLRASAILCLLAACLLLVAEFFAGSLGAQPGGLMVAGAVFCLFANLLGVVLLIRRRRDGD